MFSQLKLETDGSGIQIVDVEVADQIISSYKGATDSQGFPLINASVCCPIFYLCQTLLAEFF